MIKDIRYINNDKNSDIAIVLGNGCSINYISNDEWNCITKCDTFVLNYFLYHNFIPKFYYLELKDRYFDHWKKIRQSKDQTYNNVKFIVSKSRCKKYAKAIGKNQIYTYIQYQHWNSKRENIKLPKSFLLHDRKLTKAYSGSLSILIDLIWKMRYKYIVFYGVDLINSKYFWTDNPEYNDTHTNTNKGYSQDHNHNTFGIQNYLYDFYTKFCIKKQKWYTGTLRKKTALGKYFKHIDICKLLKKVNYESQ